MKTTYIYIRLTFLILFSGLCSIGQAQDSISSLTNKNAIYARPFLAQFELGRSTTAVGGYLEANTNYFSTDGITEGFSMEFRRFNIFLFSEILPGIRFMSELEFEHGVEEINLETALLDFEMNPSLIFRAGIILPPIGYFNQNHDSPKWEFIERPIVSTSIIPSTLSEVGFGLHGAFFPGNGQITYESYLVNGLTSGIVANEENRTALRKGKKGILEEDENARPSITGRLAWVWNSIGEIGISYYGGIYNSYKMDGIVLDKKRRLDLLAFDYRFEIKDLKILGEAGKVWVDVPPSMGPQIGEKQWGFHTDLIYPVIKARLFHWPDVKVNLALRIEYADFNQGKFSETDELIYDDIFALVPGISLRFSPNTVIRANYRYHWERDLFGNPPSKTAGFQVGIASYF